MTEWGNGWFDESAPPPEPNQTVEAIDTSGWFSDLTNVFARKVKPMPQEVTRETATSLDRGAVIRHLHSSSRFDRSPESLRNSIDHYKRGHNLLTFTEVDNSARAKALSGHSGWGVLQSSEGGGAGECATMYDKKLFEPLSHRAIALTDMPTSDRGDTRVHMAASTLRHIPSQKIIRTGVTHYPAHIESAMGFREENRRDVAAFQSAIRTTNDLAARWQNKERLDGILITGDWNLDWRKLWVRRYLNTRLKGLHCNFRGRIPSHGGTHGSRLIDFTYTDSLVIGASLYRDDASSDHRPFHEVIRIR